MSKHLGPFPGPVNDLHSEIAGEQGQDRTPREEGRDLPRPSQRVGRFGPPGGSEG